MDKRKRSNKMVMSFAATAFVFAVGAGTALPVFSQQRPAQQVQQGLVTVRGRVLDQKKEPLPGAKIQVKGLNLGTVSDYNGNFLLRRVPMGATLEVYFVGMKPGTVKVKGEDVIEVILKEDKTELSEVVVTGYSEIRKDRMTGSASTINSSEFKNLDVKSMDQILKGAVSGVTTYTSGRPGETAKIRIRGANSLTGNTEPIWIIDGMPMQGEPPKAANGSSLEEMLFQNGIGNIPPDDIESINILKDAAASAIYGARAANGVIVVKTKRGAEGPTRFNVTAHFGLVERPQNTLPLMNSEQKIRFEREVFHDTDDSSIGRAADIYYRIGRGTLSAAEGEAELARMARTNTNWFREIYRPAFSTQISMSASGGSTKTRHYTAINFSDENGTEYNNNHKRFRFSSKVDYSLSSKLELQTDIAATYVQDRRSASAIGSLQYALRANPYETPDGYDMSYLLSSRYSAISPGLRWKKLNVMSEIMNNTDYTRRIEPQLNTRLKWDTPLEGLTAMVHGTVNASVSVSRKEIQENTYTSFTSNWLQSIYPHLSEDQARGSLQEASYASNSYTMRSTLQYVKDWDSAHNIDFMAGSEISHMIGYTSGVTFPTFDKTHRVIGYPELTDDIEVKNINFRGLGSTGRFESKLASLFLSGSYSYLDKYILSGSVRYDGSNVIGNQNQFTPLWNVSGRWNVHRESFFKKNDIINALSLRFGYGYTGSIDKNALPFVVMYVDENVLYDGQKIPSNFNYANPSIKWQTKQDFNLGAEISALSNRLRLNVNYYNNRVFDLLDSRHRPLSSGVSRITENVANLTNKGWEFDLSGTIIESGKFSWSAQANFAINENKVTVTGYKSLADIPSGYHGTGYENNALFVEGYSTGEWFGYKFAGIDPGTGHTLAYTKDGETQDMDLIRDGSQEVKTPELRSLGVFDPPFSGGFSTSFTWDRLVLSMSMEYQGGHHIPSFSTFGSFSPYNRSINDEYRWRGVGDIAPFPAMTQYAQAYGRFLFDRHLERGDYLRCTYLTLGYNLPTHFLKMIGLESARLSLTANNLFTITGYKGLDPALRGSTGGYPASRRYSLSLNISL